MAQLTREKFKEKFDLPNNGFLEPIDLTDIKIGFSVYKNRLQEGFKSLFRVYIKDEDLNNESLLKPLIISATYGKETGQGITVASSDFKRGRDWPIELISQNDFFYNSETEIFLDKKGRTITGMKILEQVDQQHLKPSRLIRGFWLRTKLFWFHTVFTSFFEILFEIIAGLQYLISGNKIKIFDNLTEPQNRSRPSERQSLLISRSKPIKIFEYEVESWIAALYSSFHLLLYGIFYFYSYKPLWLVSIFKNNFLTTSYVIVSLGLANVILPKLLKPNKTFNWILLVIQNRYLKCAFKKIKI